MTTFFKKL